jgi:hypothetical protein
MDQISSDWAALVPEDRVTIRYAELTGREAKAGVTGDRRFVWGPAQRLETVQTTGDAELVEWSIVAAIRLSAAGRGRSAASQAAAHEISALAAVVVNRASWPSGVLDIQERETSTEYDGTSGDAILTVAFTVLTAEIEAVDYAPPLVIAPPPPESESYAIEPDPDSVVGDGSVTIGTIGLVPGDHTIRVTAWCDTTLGPAAAVTVRLLDPDAVEMLALTTEATVPATLTEGFTVTETGAYSVTVETDEPLGTARVSSILVTMDDYAAEASDEGAFIIVDPDPDSVVGDGEVTIGTVALVAGDYSVTATMYCDTTLSDPATVSVRVRSGTGVEAALMQTASVTPVEVTDTFTVSTEAGLHTITAATSTFSGTIRIELVTITREV